MLGYSSLLICHCTLIQVHLCCGCLFISDLKASERQCSFDNQVISVDVQEDMLQSLPKLLDFCKKQ